MNEKVMIQKCLYDIVNHTITHKTICSHNIVIIVSSWKPHLIYMCLAKIHIFWLLHLKLLSKTPQISTMPDTTRAKFLVKLLL